jgi:hypothetical protein
MQQVNAERSAVANPAARRDSLLSTSEDSSASPCSNTDDDDGDDDDADYRDSEYVPGVNETVLIVRGNKSERRLQQNLSQSDRHLFKRLERNDRTRGKEKKRRSRTARAAVITHRSGTGTAAHTCLEFVSLTGNLTTRAGHLV